MDTTRTSTQASLPVAVDVMGGDHGPGVVAEGAIQAFSEYGIRSILVGRQEEVDSALRSLGASELNGVSVHHASEVIRMEDAPSVAIRNKPNSSIRVAFELVKSGQASSVVSPGNTGAVMVAGIFISGVMPGITRPAIASLIPKAGDLPPTILLDSGANLDCDAHQLVQFALMGKCFAHIALSLRNPRIGILSNGTELSKGSDITRAASSMLSQIRNINFVGYVEGRDMARNIVDVVVCDGFIGNIVLKTMEGTAALVLDSIRHAVEYDIIAKIGLWFAKPAIKKLFRDRLDPSSLGGAPFLGLNDISIICHGSADSRAVKNAIKVAHTFVKEDLIGELDTDLSSLDDTWGTNAYEGSFWERMGGRIDKRRPKKKNR